MNKEQELESNRLIIKDRTQLSLVENFMDYADGYLSEIITWNDIMPVVDKIESLDCTLEVRIFRNCAKVVPDQFHKFLIPSIETTKIEAVWIVVIRFINWYNQNK